MLAGTSVVVVWIVAVSSGLAVLGSFNLVYSSNIFSLFLNFSVTFCISSGLLILDRSSNILETNNSIAANSILVIFAKLQLFVLTW